jgi:hypothetical protein
MFSGTPVHSVIPEPATAATTAALASLGCWRGGAGGLRERHGTTVIDEETDHGAKRKLTGAVAACVAGIVGAGGAADAGLMLDLRAMAINGVPISGWRREGDHAQRRR